MPKGEADICGLERLQKAQILLDLFEQDCGRAAVTLEEVGDWAVQNREHLKLRMKRRLLELLLRNPDDSKLQCPADAVIGFRRPPRGWRSLRRNPTPGLSLLRRILGANRSPVSTTRLGRDP
jgi:hypothetical protein